MMNLLVVEDCHEILKLLEERLIEQGHVVHTSSNGKEALEFLEQGSMNIDAILSDYEMPYINGLELFRRIKTLHSPPHPHFILISGKAHQIENIIHQGIYALLAKPISFEILDSYLERIETQIRKGVS